MLEDSPVRRLHSQYAVRKTGHTETSPDVCEELELTVTDIGGAKASDIYNDIQKIKGLVNDRPIHVTRDSDKVYHFYFWMQYVRFQSPELSVHRLAISTLK